MKSVLQIIFFMAFLLSTAEVHAIVIGFDDNPDRNNWVTSITSSGFIFSEPDGATRLGTTTNIDSRSASNGTVHLARWSERSANEATIRMESVDSSLFSLISFDFASGRLDKKKYMADSVSITGFDSEGAQIAYTSFDRASFTNLSFTTLSLLADFQALSYAELTSYGGKNRAAYDNISVEKLLAVSEPASLFLLTLGLIALIHSRHNAKKEHRLDHSSS